MSKDNILVKQAYIYEKMQTEKRKSIENTIKKTNEKLNVLLKREIVIDKKIILLNLCIAET